METLESEPDQVDQRDEKLWPQELVMVQQIQRQRNPLQIQRDRTNEWQHEERKLLDKLVIADTFQEHTTDYPNWEFAAFHPGWAGREPAAEAKGEWMPTNFHCGPHGL